MLNAQKATKPYVRIALLFAVIGSAAGLMSWETSTVHAQTPTKLKWVLTAQISTPAGRLLYRFEDPDLKIVCYVREEDFSGGFACAKK